MDKIKDRFNDIQNAFGPIMFLLSIAGLFIIGIFQVIEYWLIKNIWSLIQDPFAALSFLLITKIVLGAVMISTIVINIVIFLRSIEDEDIEALHRKERWDQEHPPIKGIGVDSYSALGESRYLH